MTAPRGVGWERIYAVVRRIPRGRVATYGQIATLAGMHGKPRVVGYALHALPNGSDVPWQRVINAAGRISPRAGAPAGLHPQRILLEIEGVKFDARGRVPLERYRWEPRPRARAAHTAARTATGRRRAR